MNIELMAICIICSVKVIVRIDNIPDKVMYRIGGIVVSLLLIFLSENSVKILQMNVMVMIRYGMLPEKIPEPTAVDTAFYFITQLNFLQKRMR